MFFSTFVTDALGADLARALSVVGFLIYVGNYLLLTFRLLNSDSLGYFGGQALAAFCVLIGLAEAFNMASAMIQVFFLAISLCGVLIRVRIKVAAPPRSDGPLGSDPRWEGGFPETGFLDPARR